MGIDISRPVGTLLAIWALTFVALVLPLPTSVGTFEFAIFYPPAAIGVGDSGALGWPRRFTPSSSRRQY